MKCEEETDLILWPVYRDVIYYRIIRQGQPRIDEGLGETDSGLENLFRDTSAWQVPSLYKI